MFSTTSDLGDCLGITQFFRCKDRFLPSYVRKCQHQGSRTVVRFTGIEEDSEELKSLTKMRSVPLTNYERWG